MVKLTEEIVKEINYGKYKDLNNLELSQIFGVTVGHIKSIRNRKTWKEI